MKGTIDGGGFQVDFVEIIRQLCEDYQTMELAEYCVQNSIENRQIRQYPKVYELNEVPKERTVKFVFKARGE